MLPDEHQGNPKCYHRVHPSREGLLIPVNLPEGCNAMPSSLVTFAISACPETFLAPDPPPGPYYRKLVFLSQSIDPIFMDFTKSFTVIMSDLYSAYFVPQGDSCMLCST